MVIPKRHYENIFDIPVGELQEVMALLKKVVKVYESKLAIQNIQLINNSGAEAQQEVFHLHFHIVPRSLGDGKNITWTTHPELRTKFNELIKAIHTQ